MHILQINFQHFVSTLRIYAQTAYLKLCNETEANYEKRAEYEFIKDYVRKLEHQHTVARYYVQKECGYTIPPEQKLALKISGNFLHIIY